jgi:hypothetical protein
MRMLSHMNVRHAHAPLALCEVCQLRSLRLRRGRLAGASSRKHACATDHSPNSAKLRRATRMVRIERHWRGIRSSARLVKTWRHAHGLAEPSAGRRLQAPQRECRNGDGRGSFAGLQRASRSDWSEGHRILGRRPACLGAIGTSPTQARAAARATGKAIVGTGAPLSLGERSRYRDQPADVGVIVPAGGLADSPAHVRKLA